MNLKIEIDKIKPETISIKCYKARFNVLVFGFHRVIKKKSFFSPIELNCIGKLPK